MPHRCLPTLALICLLVAPPAPARDEPPEPWPDQKVLIRTRIALPVAGRAAPGLRVVRVYTVDRIGDDRLHLVAGRAQGWVPLAAVVRQAEAVDYFTRRIEEHPDSAFAYLSRAVAHADQDRHEAAIADCDAALRLDPTATAALLDRGSSWDSGGSMTRPSPTSTPCSASTRRMSTA